MFRKIVTWVIVIPLVVVIVAFAVANRQAVTVSFDPFSSVNPAYAVTLPLFAVLFATLIFGVLIGGVAAWLGQSRWRRMARKLDSEVKALQRDVDAMNSHTLFRGHPAPSEPAPLPVIPPPVP